MQRHTQDIDLKDAASKTDRTVDIEISYNIGQGMESSKNVLNEIWKKKWNAYSTRIGNLKILIFSMHS